MLYAKVVLGIPVEGPFDYIVPQCFSNKIKVGSRVMVNFGAKNKIAYIVKISKQTNIKKLKPIIEVIDEVPILDKHALLLTKRLSQYYCCSWGEAIETSLPLALRKGKGIKSIINVVKNKKVISPEATLVHGLEAERRWDIYLERIKEAIKENYSVIILLPDLKSVLKAKERISCFLGISVGILYRNQPKELESWLSIKSKEVSVAIGTRSSVFAPLDNLGLIIIDEEQDQVYKQEQVPHYNAREVAFLRMQIERTKLILGSPSPSLEMLLLARKNKIRYIFKPFKKGFPEVRILDTRYDRDFRTKEKIDLNKYLVDQITSILNQKGKALLFINRKGFATFVFCHTCKEHLKCPRCSINLVYHFKENILRCHHCNFKMELPKICPHCNSGYIKFSGLGTEKIESELSRIFPSAKIKRLDDSDDIDNKEADIFVSTSTIIKQTNLNFDLVAALAIDNSINRLDIRATEKTFVLLVGLLGLTNKLLVIQTNFAGYGCLKALVNKDINKFYDEELVQRKQLGFPPYVHLIAVKLRGRNEERVKKASLLLFDKLKEYNSNRDIKPLSVNAGYPFKLRENFYWQILISTKNIKAANKILRLRLKNFPHSGIILTVDVDPI